MAGACFWCEGVMPERPIANYRQCEGCAAIMNGGVAVIEVKPLEPNQRRPAITGNLAPTGNWFAVIEDSLVRFLKLTGLSDHQILPILANRYFLTPSDVFEVIAGRAKEPENVSAGGPSDNRSMRTADEDDRAVQSRGDQHS